MAGAGDDQLLALMVDTACTHKQDAVLHHIAKKRDLREIGVPYWQLFLATVVSIAKRAMHEHSVMAAAMAEYVFGTVGRHGCSARELAYFESLMSQCSLALRTKGLNLEGRSFEEALASINAAFPPKDTPAAGGAAMQRLRAEQLRIRAGLMKNVLQETDEFVNPYAIPDDKLMALLLKYDDAVRDILPPTVSGQASKGKAPAARGTEAAQGAGRRHSKGGSKKRRSGPDAAQKSGLTQDPISQFSTSTVGTTSTTMTPPSQGGVIAGQTSPPRPITTTTTTPAAVPDSPEMFPSQQSQTLRDSASARAQRRRMQNKRRRIAAREESPSSAEF